jgi:V8-like Glu-specific endopeptidase
VLHWLLALLLLAPAAAAQAPERRMLEAEEATAFRGVGRLNVAGRRFCTATLITPSIVVTAAHCLYHPRTHARVPVSELRFVAGLRLGETAAVRRTVRAVTQPDFAFEGLAEFSGVRSDLALIELDEPIPADAALPFATAALAPGAAPLAIVSYARDRAQAPSIEAPCGLISTFGGVAALDCAVTYGASGAPVLQGEGDATRLVGVVSAMGRVLASEREVTLSVLVGPEIDALLEALAAAPMDE